MLKTELLKIPMQMMQYVNAQKLFKALGVYLMLKGCCSGHLMLTKDIRRAIMEQLRIHTVASFNKYIGQLKELNWIGVDDATNTYYVRGFNFIRKQYGWFNSTSVVFTIAKDAKQIKTIYACNLDVLPGAHNGKWTCRKGEKTSWKQFRIKNRECITRTGFYSQNLAIYRLIHI